MDFIQRISTNRHAQKHLVLVLTLLLATACAGLDVAAMIPPLVPNSGAPDGRSIRVGDFSEEPRSAPLRAPVTPEQLQRATTASIERAKIFSRVRRDDPADLLLRGRIVGQRISQDRGVITTEFRREIVVFYEVVEQRSGNVLWRTTVRSEAGAPLHFGGQAANVEAGQEGAKANLQVLINDLAKQFAPK